MNLSAYTPYVSSIIHKSFEESKTFINEIPKRWKEDLREVNYEEILASSISILALFFNWKKNEKSEFAQIASGSMASSIIHADPISTIASIVCYAYAYTKQKRKSDLRRFKWASIEGLVGVGAFALSVKFISTPILNYLVGICLAVTVKKTVKTLRLFEHLNFLRKLKFNIKLPVLKKSLSRRELIHLNLFKYGRS